MAAALRLTSKLGRRIGLRNTPNKVKTPVYGSREVTPSRALQGDQEGDCGDCFGFKTFKKASPFSFHFYIFVTSKLFENQILCYKSVILSVFLLARKTFF